MLFFKYLPQYGVESEVVGTGSGPLTATLNVRRAWVKVIAGQGARAQLRAIVHHLTHLWRARHANYDVLQVRDRPITAVLAWWIARRARRPFFYWMSFPVAEGAIERARGGPRRLGWTRWLFVSIKGYLGRCALNWVVLPGAAHIFTQSDRMAAELAARGVPWARLTPVPMGVDGERINTFDSTRLPPIVDERLRERPVLVYLGAIERLRGSAFLFDVLQAVRVSEPRACLLLVGDAEASEKAWLDDEIKQRHLESAVIVTGWLDTTTAWRYVRCATIAYSAIPLTSLYVVSSPTKTIEYLALGIPVIASRLPDHEVVVEGSGGGECVDYSVAAFSAATLRLLGDPDRLRMMANAGPRYVAAHRDYRVMSGALARRYREIMAVRA